ncbi:cysteine desulfurase family protein [Salirhabdus sp. Marseille-P4669]|uniref:cysteine desulfurase family protein n=1 Tax=Salirhabdus sp. Marseille-P4669 TaxID=2042310 RepID=UPI000C798A6F|nr:cysteine desulfurase family protein [Salirhabdus sp. Marseille-P4669]
MIYLDNSATTRPYKEVIDSFNKVSQAFFANPSSIHYLGGEVEQLLQKAKMQAAELLHVGHNELIFTSGGTESNNLAIKGIALQHQNRGKHIITSQVEHPSVLEACAALETIGFEVTYLPVTKYGRVNPSDLESAIRPDTILISIMHVNNEIGVIQPIEEIANIAQKYPKVFFHVDYVQGLGKIPLSLNHPGIDLCSMSSHKIHGLKGTGILYIKSGTVLFPILHGGGQQSSIRPGTENVAGQVAMVKALRITLEQQHEYKRLVQLNKLLRSFLLQEEKVVINSPEDGAAHILNFSVPGYKPEVIIHALGKRDIFISTKSACSSKHSDESAVLAACGLNTARTHSGLRISLSYENTEEEIRQFYQAFKDVLAELQNVMG